VTVFTRALPSYRVVAIDHDDTLQSIAGRELGDANRWVELAWINSLVWPYITRDPRRAGPTVLLAGAFIKVPAPKGTYSGTQETGQVFERDCAMQNRLLADDGAGDFAVVAGSKNLVQQLQHRLSTPRGQARRHPLYGSLMYRLIGTLATPVANLLSEKYAEAAIQADYRVNAITNIQAAIVGDDVNVTARAETIAGGPVDIKIGQQS